MRCVICNKKITFSIGCRCGKIFCNKHRLPMDHNCNISIRELNMKEIEKKNPKIIKEKIQKI